MAQDVLIDFQVDYSSLDTAIESLEKLGLVDKQLAAGFKTTNQEIAKQSTAIKQTATALKAPIQSLDQLDKKTKSFIKNFVGGFEEGVQEALKEAGVTMKEFTTALEQNGVKGVKSTTSIRQELKNLTQQIAEAKASGGPVSQEMINRAGQLKDALKDASAEIANAGSDTRNIDNVVGSVSALAGAFSAAQGAAALFGDDSEDLQKALLRVNAAMAVATGLQQFFNAIQKEGSLIKLADVIATKAQIAVQTIYTAVTGRATAATLAFKVALAATGIGLVVVGVLALVNALKQTSNELEKATRLIDQQSRALESYSDQINQATELEIARAELAGKAESDLIAIRGRGILQQRADLVESNNILAIQRDALSKTSRAWFELNQKIADNAEAIGRIDNTLLITDLNRQKQIIEERKKAADDAKQKAKELKALQDKALQDAREARIQEFEDFKAGKELELLKAKEGSEEQLNAHKDFLRAKLALDLEADKLTDNEKKLLIQKFFADRLELEKQFNRKRDETILSDIASDLNTELQQLNLTNERKLELTETAIRVASELEILAAEGNAAKIQEIAAKRDKAIRDAKLASLNETAERELQLAEANNGVRNRALQRVANDEKKSSEIRINAIIQLLDTELDAIQRRIDANQEALDKGLISQEEYNLKSAQLNDQYNQAWENAEEKKAEITEKANEKIKEANRKLIEDTVSTFLDAVSVLGSVFDAQAATENNRIAAQKRQLEELKEAGAITEKEAISRQKRIEAEERKARQRQAQRDKTIAVFNALLAIPSAILQGLKQGGPVLGAIYGALAAAQAALVIARPIPKFSKGKKDRYSGFGWVGDAGNEMIERNGKLFVTTKPTITYLGPKDKVFTASETKRMMPSVKREFMNKPDVERMDYDKLARKIAEAMKGTQTGSVINIDKEFISESVANGLQKNNYFDRYYSSK